MIVRLLARLPINYLIEIRIFQICLLFWTNCLECFSRCKVCPQGGKTSDDFVLWNWEIRMLKSLPNRLTEHNFQSYSPLLIYLIHIPVLHCDLVLNLITFQENSKGTATGYVIYDKFYVNRKRTSETIKEHKKNAMLPLKKCL